MRNLSDKAQLGWRGWVDGEVLEARDASWLRYSWIDDDHGPTTYAR